MLSTGTIFVSRVSTPHSLLEQDSQPILRTKRETGIQKLNPSAGGGSLFKGREVYAISIELFLCVMKGGETEGKNQPKLNIEKEVQ